MGGIAKLAKGLFDLSDLRKVPDVPQVPLERYDPPRGMPKGLASIITPENAARLEEIAKRGMDMGGPEWYNLEPLRLKFVAEKGEEEGNRLFRRYVDYVAATSPRSKVDANIRRGSYFYGREMQGLPVADLKNPQLPKGYGHLAHETQNALLRDLEGGGTFGALNRPKTTSFAENLAGNQEPMTIDTHNMALVVGPKRSPSQTEYRYLEDFQAEIADKLGLTPAQFQASLWVAGDTGVANPRPFMEIFDQVVERTAVKDKKSKEEVLKDFITGDAPLYGLGTLMSGLMVQDDKPVADGMAAGGAVSAVAKAIRRLVEAGFPESTAEKIVRGDLPMDTASRMARAREQGFDVDTRYYHGTPYAQGVADEGFSPSFLGKGHDEYGPGFYFSDDPRLASGYARETRAKGDGREVSPGMIEAFLRSNPLNIIREGDKSSASAIPTGIPLKLTQQSAEDMIERAPGVLDADGPLSNFFEPSSPAGYTQGDISKVAREYAGDDADYLLNDLYRGDSQSFLDALTDVTGVDSVDVFFPEFPLSSVKTVFRPDQIRSPYAAFDPDQADSPNLLAGLAPYAVPTVLGGSILGAAMTPEKAKAAGFGTLARAIGRPTQRLFQGSPSKFATPSLQSVGTGTGDQAFGYGLYFSESPDIAGNYKRALSNKKLISSLEDQGLVPGVSSGELDDMIEDGVFGEAETRFLRALKDADYLGFDNGYAAAMTALKRGDLATRYDAAGDPAVANLDKLANELGFLYEVEVPEGNFIEWDLPLSEQPEVVQQVVKEKAPPEMAKRIESGQLKGLEAYFMFGRNPEVNSMMWSQYGVPGIRYSAVRSKEGKLSPDAPRNYVIFDENLINVVRRNDEALENNFDELAARMSATDVRRPMAAVLGAGAAGATQAAEMAPGEYDARASERLSQELDRLLQLAAIERQPKIEPLDDRYGLATIGDYLTENRPSEMDTLQRALQSNPLVNLESLGDALRTTGYGDKTTLEQDIMATLDLAGLLELGFLPKQIAQIARMRELKAAQ